MKEWYLIDNYKPTVTSGYESDAISEFAESNFADVLETIFAKEVVLYNYDLSEPKTIRCIIQGNSADTQLNAMRRIGLFPIGTVKAGMYIYYENVFWLITGYPGSNGIYEKAVMDICQYKLKWQNKKGEVIERWGNYTSAAKYDDGTTGDYRITLSSDDLTILLPQDEETLYLGDKRVFIDKKPIPEKVYKITRTDDVLFDYGGRGGIISFIADKTELDPARDNQEIGICDYVTPTDTSDDETPDIPNLIVGTISGSANIKVGFKRTYTATLADSDGNAVAWSNDYSWRIVDNPDVTSNIQGDRIELLVKNKDLIDTSFILQVVDGNDLVIAEMTITVIDVF